MPRLLKRLSLVFAVLVLGLLLAGWLALRALATNLMTSRTEPVRAQLVADWAKHADQLEADLGAVTAWNTPGGRTPPELGCQLRWSGESPAVQQHLARCPTAPAPLDEQTLSALDDLGDQLLARSSEAPTLDRDLGWMAPLPGQDDWSQAAGTPFEFFEVDPAALSLMDAPTLVLPQVRGLALLRLLQGQRSGALEPAVADVAALARALLGRPFVSDQLVGVHLLQRTRTLLDAAGRPELGPPRAELQALRRSRLASAMLWHPWVPKAQRERFLPKIAPASRCAAASEALLVLELGPPLTENYPEFVSELAAWSKTGACQSDFVHRALQARARLPAGSWQPLLRASEFIHGAQQGEWGPSALVKIIESSPLGRRTITEVILSVQVARPFAEDEKP